MKNKYVSRIIDIVGKLLLLWFLYSTCIYFYSGRLIQELKMISSLWNYSLWNFIYTIIQIPVESIGIFILIPLLLKGHRLGLAFGIIYWFLGYFLNPLWYIIPRNLQVSPDGSATTLLWTINIIISIMYIVIIMAFYFHRRKQNAIIKIT